MEQEEMETKVPYMDKLTYDKELQLSDHQFGKKLKGLIKPSTKTKIEQLKDVPPYPSPYIFAMLSNKAYKGRLETDEEYENRLNSDLPTDWKLLTTACSGGSLKLNDYFGVAFYNNKHCQIIIAHRGSRLTSFGDLLSDGVGVCLNNYVRHMSSACTFAHLVHAALENHYEIFFTGHSLGGWLAQITTFSLKYLKKDEGFFKRNTVEGYHAHTIVFESPGCKDMLEKMASDFDVRYAEKTVYVEPLDITTYLSAPNIVNCCNFHLGTIYRLYPAINTEMPLQYTTESHGMEGLLKCFDSKIEEIRQNKEHPEIMLVSDWPKFYGIEYKNFFKFANSKNRFDPKPESVEVLDSESTNKVVLIRYQTKTYQGNVCSPSVFTQSELEFLQVFQWLKTVPEFFQPIELFNELDGELQSLEDRSFIMSHLEQISYGKTIKVPSNANLRDLIPFLKTLLRLAPDVKSRAMNALNSFEARKTIYKNMSIEYRKKIKPLLKAFQDGKWPELQDFLKEDSTLNVCQILAKDTDVASAQVLKQVKSSMFDEIFNIDLHIAVSVDKSFLLRDVLRSSELAKALLVLECNDSTLNDDAMSFIIELMNITKVNINVKIILITAETDEKSTKLKPYCDIDIGLKKKYKCLTCNGISWNHLTKEAQESLLRKNLIKFQGQNEKINLCDLLGNKMSELDLIELSKIINPETLVKFIKDETVAVGKPIASLENNYYIQRQFRQMPKYVSEQVLEKDMNVSKVNPESGKSNEKEHNEIEPQPASFQITNTNQLTQLEINLDEKQLVNWGDNEIEIRITSRIVETKTWSEDEILTLICGSNIDKAEIQTLIISDGSGMGKTTLFSSLLPKLKNLLPKHWLIRVNLNDCAEVLGETLKNKSITDETEPKVAVDFFIDEILESNDNSKLRTNFEKQLLKMAFIKHGNVVLFFDSFDEISPKYDEIVTRMLLALRKTKFNSIVVTTRPHIEAKLEKTFGTCSYTMNPFSKEDQVEFLVKFWNYHLELEVTQNESKKLRNIANKSIDKLTHSVRDLYSVFLGIPLHCEMLAEFMLDKSNKKVTPLSEEISFKYLYDTFVENKLKIYNYEKGSGEQKLSMENKNGIIEIQLRKFHWLYALGLLLSEDQRARIQPPQIDEDIKLNLEQVALDVGLMTKLDENHQQFIHRAFAEYFFLDYVLHVAKKQTKNERNLEILSPILLFNSEFQISRCFLDSMLRNGEIETEIARICKIYVDQDKHIGEAILAYLLTEKCPKLFRTLFDYFIKNCSTETVKSVVQAKAVRMNGNTALHVAALIQDKDNLRLLINNGAIIDVEDDMGRTPFHHACQHGDKEIFLELVKESANAKTRDKDGWEPLHLAAQNGHKDIVEMLLKEGCNVNTQNKVVNQTPLLLASRQGHHETVQFLLRNGANVDARSSERRTSLHLASLYGHIDIIRTLFEHHCNANPIDAKDLTPIHYAAQTGQFEAIAILAENECNISPRSNAKVTPLHIAAFHGYERIVKLLIEKSKKKNHIDVRNDIGQTPLHFASTTGRLGGVQILISNRADVNSLDKNHCSPLHLATLRGDLEMVKFLVQNNANLNGRVAFESPPMNEINGWCVLHMACYKGHIDLVRFLIQNGVDVNIRDNNRQTSLHVALKSRQEHICKLLIKKAIEINSKDANGLIPLHFACYHGFLDICRILVDKGSVINLKDKLEGSTPTHLATKSGFESICRLLVDKGAEVNKPDHNGNTILHMWSSFGNVDMVKFLIQRGANVNAADIHGCTPLYVGVEQGHLEVVRLLLNAGADTEIANIDNLTPLELAHRLNKPRMVDLFPK